MMTKCYIFDIDGTLADCAHRRQYVATKPKNWAAFNAGAVHDKPIEPVIHVMRALAFSTIEGSTHQPRFSIICCSGREEVYRRETQAWLNDWFAPFDRLYMRKAKDYRPDDLIKEELLAEIRADGYEPIGVFDDRKRVVDMWIRNGLFVFDVAQGKGDF